MTFEEKLIYFPEKYPAGFWNLAGTSGRSTAGVADNSIVPLIEDCWFTTSDNVRLHGWYCAPVQKKGDSFVPVAARMTVLWFHGNAGNLSHRYDMIRMLIGLPVNIFIIDYRGYGRSEGSPSENGLYLDARAAWDYLTSGRGISPEKIILFGKSLGGVPAIDLATRVEPAGLIAQSSFTSAADVAAQVLPLYPAMFLRTKMDSLSKVRNVTCPKLFIHSRADEVIPFKLGVKLFEAAPEPKEFYEVAGAPHNSTYLVGGKDYFNAIKRFVERCSRSI
jgi:hypothetical protein